MKKEDEKLKIKTIKELYEMNFPPTKWLVEKLIPEDAITILSAPPSSFKTWLILEIAGKMSKGEKLFGKYETKKAGVLLLDEESGERQLSERFRKLRINESDNIHYQSLSGRKLSSDYIEELVVYCRMNEIGLVVFDSLARFHTANENDATEMARVAEKFVDLKKHGIASLIICHTRKSNGFNHNFSANDSVRGSSDIVAMCDNHISIRRDNKKNYIVISQTKNRFDEECLPFMAKLVKDNSSSSHWEYLKDIDNEKSEWNKCLESVFELVKLHQYSNQKQLIGYSKEEQLGLSEKKIRGALAELEGQGRIESNTGERTAKIYFSKEDF